MLVQRRTLADSNGIIDVPEHSALRIDRLVWPSVAWLMSSKSDAVPSDPMRCRRSVVRPDKS
jgi:hypothetical protein